MKKFKIPSSLTIVMAFLLFVTVLTWFVPSSVVTRDEKGESQIHYGASFDEEGNIIENTGTKPKGIWNLFLAPIEGFISSADVSATILVSGGALAILGYCGALDAGIYLLLRKFKGRSLIILLMLVFALMGTVYGSWEELPAYALAIIPLFISAGYDAFTGTAVIVAGSTVGNMASVVNPYSVGSAVASVGNSELTLGSGIILRLVLFLALFALAAFLVITYAESIKKEPAQIEGSQNLNFTEMTPRRKWSLFVFLIMILACVAGYIPWDSVKIGDSTAFSYINGFIPNFKDSFFGKLLGLRSLTPFGLWYFNEFSVTWLIGSVVIAFINRMTEEEFVREFIRGASELISVVLVLSAARGIAVTMGKENEGMSITFISAIEDLLSGVPLWAFAGASIAIYVLIGLFLQSTSGVAGITMPVFASAATALFANTPSGAAGGQIILISAFTCGISFMSGIYPGATVMGILEIGEISFGTYLKNMLKILLPLLILAGIIITSAPYIGLI